MQSQKEFLSTLPARGATEADARGGTRYTISIHAPREGSDAYRTEQPGQQRNFYPRSPRGERPALCGPLYPVAPISIHAPREGSDSFIVVPAAYFCVFLSTLPARGATAVEQLGYSDD